MTHVPIRFISTLQPFANVLVSLVCRSNYPTISKSGVELETNSFGDYHFQPHLVFPDIQSAKPNESNPEWHYVVVTTKALPDVVDDSETIEPLITPSKSTIVLIQNGVGIENPHRKRFPQNIILSAVTVISAEQISHGLIRQNKWTRISIGPFTSQDRKGTEDSLSKLGDSKCQEFVSYLKDLGSIKDAESLSETDLQLVRWHKLCINASMNPSSILSGGLPNNKMVLDPSLKLHLKSCMEEIFNSVPKILGCEFPEKFAKPEKILQSIERNKGGAKPSMLIDWEKGNMLELEVILGNPVRIARENGVVMERLESMYGLLRSAQEVRERKKKEKGEKGKL